MLERRSSRLGIAFFVAWPLVPVVVSVVGVTRFGVDPREGARPAATAAAAPAGGAPSPAAPTGTARIETAGDAR